MGLREWSRNLFSGSGDVSEDTTIEDAFCALPSQKLTELSIKKWAIDSCVNKIANAISKAEVQTFVKGEEVRNSTWYLLNIEPNQNQNATEFWKKLVTKLVYENEALIFGINNHLYVADSFEQVKFSFRENIYRNIVLKDFSVKTIFNESSVIHLTLNNRNIKSVIDGFYKMYGNLITQGIANYKKNE